MIKEILKLFILRFVFLLYLPKEGLICETLLTKYEKKEKKSKAWTFVP